jgi:hypothetical protein
MTRSEHLAQLRAQWPTVLGIVIAVAWIGWRHGIDLAASFGFVLALVGALEVRLQRVIAAQLAAGALLQATANVVANQLVRDGAKKVERNEHGEVIH